MGLKDRGLEDRRGGEGNVGNDASGSLQRSSCGNADANSAWKTGDGRHRSQNRNLTVNSNPSMADLLTFAPQVSNLINRSET
jgi:hypothetical protein